MSPLTRSLLALTTLLAVAVAQNYNCVNKIIGQQTSDSTDLNPVDVPFGTTNVVINNFCQPPTPNHVGEMVTVCNKTPGYQSADINIPPYPSLSPVQVVCYDPQGCTVYVKEYCA